MNFYPYPKRVYCTHQWNPDDYFMTIDGKDIHYKLCDRCDVKWLQGDHMPEVEIGHTKE